ncbi:MAG: hypothetical protein LBL31_02070 [Spirochaetaceae bacterium]|jgi:hypothetical protein|nr:hypothetical protein [Spirochaetaceae bacterium]
MRKIRLAFPGLFSCAAALVTVMLAGSGERGVYIPPSESFAVVECPAPVSDRAAAAALLEHGIRGVESESTQFFLLNAWSRIEQVPLDRLEARLVDADPRRDAYAPRLRSFFVNDKTRRLFVPLSNWNGKNTLAIESALREALAGIPVSSIIILQSAQSPLSRNMGMIEKTLVLAALLMICVMVILPFFKDFLSDLACRDRKIRRSGIPLAVSLFLTAVLVASGIAGSAASAYRIVFIVLPLAFFLLGWVLPAWLRWRGARQRGHAFFRPVALRGVLLHPKRRGPPRTVAGLFALAAIAFGVSFFSGTVSGADKGGAASLSSKGYGAIVSEEEYHSHGRRQTLFSYLPLGTRREEDAPPYRRYASDSSGLYVADGTIAAAEVVIPPYPFDGLAAFVEGGQSATVPPDSPLLFFIALAALLPFAILRIRYENI